MHVTAEKSSHTTRSPAYKQPFTNRSMLKCRSAMQYALPHNLFTCFVDHIIYTWENNVNFQRNKGMNFCEM
jgi:hypothetical protein